MSTPENLNAIRKLQDGRRRRSLARLLGLEPHEVLAVVIVVALIAPFWSSAALAFITATGLQPLVRKLEKRFSFLQGNAAFFVVSLMSAIVVGMTSYTAVRVSHLSVEFARESGAMPPAAVPPQPEAADHTEEEKPPGAGKISIASIKQLQDKMREVTARWAPSYRKDVDSFMQALPKTAVTWIASHAQDFISSTLDVLTQLAFYFLFLFYFLSRGRRLMMNLMRRPETFAPRIRMWYEMTETASYTSVISTAAIGFIQASLVSVACLALGIPEWGLIFFTCFILSFFPMLGAATVPFVVAVFSFVNGDTTTGFILVALSVFVGSIDNVLRIWLMSSENDVSQVISFVGLIGAITLFGFPGLLIGPFLISLASALLSEKTKEGFRPF